MTAHESITVAFLEAALWTEYDESTPQGGEPFDVNHSVDDFAPETVHAAAIDCAAFLTRCQSEGLADFDALIAREPGEAGADGHAGHDFLLTRNGHGAGFWDGDWKEEEGEALTAIAQSFGNFNLYLGDDGLIYHSS